MNKGMRYQFLIALVLFIQFYETFALCNPPIPTTNQFPIQNYSTEIEEALKMLDEQITEVFTQSQLMGMHVVIVHDQDVLYKKGFGCARNCLSDENSQPEVPTSSDIFRVGSITKIFTNMMLFHLRDAGYVSRDTQLSTLLPALKMPNPFPPTKRGISMEMLGGHTAGLQAWAPCHGPCNLTTPEMVELLNHVPLISPPMSYVHYSNLGLALLGRALESVTPKNMSYEDYMTDYIFSPLGMNSTGFSITRALRKQMAVGYNLLEDGKYLPTEALPILGWQAPAGQMHSTPDDITKFIQMLFRDEAAANDSDQPLDGTTIREWMNSVLFQNNNSERPTSIGLPWENLIMNGKYLVRSKNGAIAGYGAELYVSPERKLAVFVNVNQQPTFKLEIQVAQLAMASMLDLFESLTVSYGESQLLPPNYQNLIGDYGFNKVQFSVQYMAISSFNNTHQLAIVENQKPVWVLQDLSDLFPFQDEFYTRVLPVSSSDSCWVYEGGAPMFEYAVFNTSSSGPAFSLTMPQSQGKHFAYPRIH